MEFENREEKINVMKSKKKIRSKRGEGTVLECPKVAKKGKGVLGLRGKI